MILYFLTIGTVTDILAVKLADGHRRRNGQRNAFVCGSEQHVKIQSVVVMNRLCIIFAQSAQLCAGHISARIHEKRGLTSALQRKIAKL